MAEDLDKKSAVLYVHKPDTQYECGDCPAWISETNRCYFHGYGDVILPLDSCGLWMKGSPDILGSSPQGWVTKQESGWVRSNYGFSCKRCEHFDPQAWRCTEVDPDSVGDDMGMIHPDACCNEWSPDPVRSQISTEDFDYTDLLRPMSSILIGIGAPPSGEEG